jgi:hypothetical protein
MVRTVMLHCGMPRPLNREPFMPTTRLVKMNAEQELQFLIGWATQTLAFCLSLRAEEVGTAPPDAGTLPDASQASALAIELWRDALAERGQGEEIEGAGSIYLKKVFDWCDNHRD